MIPEWKWSSQKEQAAVLVAEDTLPDTEIAVTVRIAKRTLERWKLEPEFSSRVRSHVETLRQAVLDQGIADRVRRVARLNDDWKRLQDIVADRAAHPDFAAVPGGSTGLLTRRRRSVGKGEDFQIIEEYAVDTGLLGEMRALEMQAAKELGQWVEKSKVDTVTAITSNPIYENYRAMTAEKLLRLHKQMLGDTL